MSETLDDETRRAQDELYERVKRRSIEDHQRNIEAEAHEKQLKKLEPHKSSTSMAEKTARLAALRTEIQEAALAGNPELVERLVQADEFVTLRAQDALTGAMKLLRDFREATKDAKSPDRAMLRMIVAHFVFVSEAGTLGASLAGARRRALEGRVSELEKKLQETQKQAVGLEYTGVYDAKRTYRKGELCTLKGSMWIVRVDETQAQPGASNDWQLCVQRGARGKDAPR